MFYIEDFDGLAAANAKTSYGTVHCLILNQRTTGTVTLVSSTAYCTKTTWRITKLLKIVITPCSSPPMMNAAVIGMLKDLGVEDENILLDDFGG